MATYPAPAGHKFREVFQLRRGSYSDLPAAKISEMMHSSSLDVSPHSVFLKIIDFFCLLFGVVILTVAMFSECTNSVTY